MVPRKIKLLPWVLCLFGFLMKVLELNAGQTRYVLEWSGRKMPAIRKETRFTAIAAGWGHTLALTREGTVLAWGYNGYRQSTVPAGLCNVIAIAAGRQHSLALKSD